MDLELIRSRLAAAATAVQGLNCYEYVPDSVTEPAFFPTDVEIAYDQAMARGMDQITVTCRVLASRIDDRAGQARLNGYLRGAGPTSLKAAIEADPTLGGACDSVRVVSAQSYRSYEHAGLEYIGAELTVEIIGEGDAWDGIAS